MAKFFNFEQDYFGQTDSEVEKKLSMYGLNTYIKESGASGFSYREVLLSPSVLLMFVAGVLCFFNGGIASGIVTLLLNLLYIAAEIYARKTADEKLAEIEDSTLMKFRVVRNGRLELIEKENIVPEDTIIVQEGERVPADAFILESRDLTVDEGAITGDRTPVAKYVGGISKSELKPTFVYSGTVVVSGIAICKVSATGEDTKIYMIKGEQEDRHPYYTSLERIVRAVVPAAGIIGVALTISFLILRIVSGFEVAPSALSGVVIGLCFIPAGIGSVIRLYYTKGTIDLMKGGAVVKSYSDIEKLNSLSVLCIEKEGAISKNRLEVRGIYARSEELLYKVAALSCEPNHNDPSIKALMVKATFFDENIKNVVKENKFIEKLPDSTEALCGAVWELGGDRLCCIKGVPEQVLPLCRMSSEMLVTVKTKIDEYYSKGCTVVVIGCMEANGNVDLITSMSYTFVGFAAFSAPLRDSVSTAVKTCRRAGVRVIMFTEENPSVAESTGKMIGISGTSVVTGAQIDEALLNDSEPDFSANIYAKISSEHKLYVIEKLEEKGEVVAMTGTRGEDSGVLDTADVGITISQHAAGAAYETADVIMNDDNFSSIADMIANARQVHRNIKRAVSSMIAGYVGLIVIVIVNLFCGSEIMPTAPLLAVITMILLPLAGLGFVGNRSDMKQVMPPSEFVAYRKLNFRFIGGAVLFGVLAGAVAISSYLFMYNGSNYEFARSCSLISYCFCSAAFVFLRHLGTDPIKSCLHWSKLTIISVAALILLPILLVYIPFVNGVFGLEMVEVLALLISIVSGVLPAIIYYFIKIFFKFKELS